MWIFESRRTGIRFKSSQISGYLNEQVLPFGDEGDLVLQNVWSALPGEIRLSYIFLQKLPTIIQKLATSNGFECKDAKACYVEYSRHLFRVLCFSESNRHFYYVKFTLTDGRNDCKILCKQIIEFREDVLKGKRGFNLFNRAADKLLFNRSEQALKNKEGRDLKIPAELLA